MIYSCPTVYCGKRLNNIIPSELNKPCVTWKLHLAEFGLVIFKLKIPSHDSAVKTKFDRENIKYPVNTCGFYILYIINYFTFLGKKKTAL